MAARRVFRNVQRFRSSKPAIRARRFAGIAALALPYGYGAYRVARGAATVGRYARAYSRSSFRPTMASYSSSLYNR